VLRPIDKTARAYTSEVDLMHVLHRPHLPRPVSVSIVAAILAIVISLALVTRLSNISPPVEITGGPAHSAAPALKSALRTTAPRWARSPFASLLSRPLPPPWLDARR
jgi:hypothetical protein